ncbi:MAG: ASKHA domain-containing protein [Bacteroidales bacterium]|nr:ASKHA domain-containing protein [Bacteroidales bacterium]
MPKITIHSQGKTSTFQSDANQRLLDILRNHGYEITAPCGGNGTCGKCKVLVKNKGYITACVFIVKEDLEVVLPEPLESSILTTQYKYSKILQLDPGNAINLSPYPFGVAIDIGTTSIALYLVQLITGAVLETQSIMNPQAKYGADVISRINYCIQHEEGIRILQQEIIQALNEELKSFVEKQDITPGEIVKITVSGNTTMLHLLLGEDPPSLAFVPFTPVFTDQQIRKASELGLHCHPDGEIKVLPSLTAYVGADIVTGIASLAPPTEHRNYLFVDIGTNGEMALVTPDGVHCCATAAGPAFEGANITHGMGAFGGAIKSYSSPDHYVTIADMPATGICGSGLIDIIAYMVSEGILQPDGYLPEDYIVADAGRTGKEGPVGITPADVREVQLAKSAIIAGIKTLVQQAELNMNEIDALYLAGGFGNYIRISSAVTLGLLPGELSEKTISVGNTSGTGAVLALKSVSFEREIASLIGRMHYTELSANDAFNLEFAMNMEFREC